MPAQTITLEILTATLSRSAVKTLITEGRDDFELFRHINDKVGFSDCLPAGNKAAVLGLCERHNEHSCPRLAYLVDSDLWVLQGVPYEVTRLPNLVLTDGYSIENDLIRDADPERFIYQADISDYYAQLGLIIKWFAAGATARSLGYSFDFDKRISHICEGRSHCFTLEAQADVLRHPPSQDLVDEITSDYKRLLRGKTWQSLISRYLNYNGRAIMHNPKAILESGLHSGGVYSTILLTKIRSFLV